MAAEVLPRPVDTTGDSDDESVHAFCEHAQLTWCGDDARRHQTVPVPESIDQVCRICLLAFEMYAPGSPCPVCGCTSCVG